MRVGRVIIAYKSLPNYRLAFFDGLRAHLADNKVDLTLVYGNAGRNDALKRDGAELPWAQFRKNRQANVCGRPLVWQPILQEVAHADLVIVEQASRLLVNYALLAAYRLGVGPKVALWGHGANLQKHTSSDIGEALKRRYSCLPHWWFAYTKGSASLVANLGFPVDRITVVQNAIDTESLRRELGELSLSEKASFAADYGLSSGYTCLFLGSLYAEKRLEYLISAARLVAAREPRFRLLLGGDGPHSEYVQRLIRERPYIAYLGRLDGKGRLLALDSASLNLMPGLVGLAVLDAFASEAPMITTAVPYHSPEIEYLEDGVNGRILERSAGPEAYAEAVLQLLGSRQTLSDLQVGCREATSHYTNAAMVERFSAGVLEALGR